MMANKFPNAIFSEKKIPQQNDRGFWLCLNLPQMGNHPS